MRKINKRKWLNPKQSWNTGYIHYRVDSGTRTHDYNIHFKVADCSRIIDLDFDFGCEQDAQESIDKARILRDSTEEFLAGLAQLAKEKKYDIK